MTDIAPLESDTTTPVHWQLPQAIKHSPRSAGESEGSQISGTNWLGTTMLLTAFCAPAPAFPTVPTHLGGASRPDLVGRRSLDAKPKFELSLIENAGYNEIENAKSEIAKAATRILARDVGIEFRIVSDQDEGQEYYVAEIDTGFDDDESRDYFDDQLFDALQASPGHSLISEKFAVTQK